MMAVAVRLIIKCMKNKKYHIIQHRIIQERERGREREREIEWERKRERHGEREREGVRERARERETERARERRENVSCGSINIFHCKSEHKRKGPVLLWKYAILHDRAPICAEGNLSIAPSNTSVRWKKCWKKIFFAKIFRKPVLLRAILRAPIFCFNNGPNFLQRKSEHEHKGPVLLWKYAILCNRAPICAEGNFGCYRSKK